MNGSPAVKGSSVLNSTDQSQASTLKIELTLFPREKCHLKYSPNTEVVPGDKPVIQRFCLEADARDNLVEKEEYKLVPSEEKARKLDLNKINIENSILDIDEKSSKQPIDTIETEIEAAGSDLEEVVTEILPTEVDDEITTTIQSFIPEETTFMLETIDEEITSTIRNTDDLVQEVTTEVDDEIISTTNSVVDDETTLKPEIIFGEEYFLTVEEETTNPSSEENFLVEDESTVVDFETRTQSPENILDSLFETTTVHDESENINTNSEVINFADEPLNALDAIDTKKDEVKSELHSEGRSQKEIPFSTSSNYSVTVVHPTTSFSFGPPTK